MFKKLLNSTRKFIRSEKARIRRGVLDPKKQEEMIKEIYNKLLNKQFSQENIKKQEVKKKEKPNQKSKIQKAKKTKTNKKNKR